MIVLSFFLSSVNKITDECGDRCRLNLADMGKERPSRSDKLLVVIRIRVRIPDHFFIFFTIAEWGIFGHLLAFLIQSEAWELS